MGLLIIGVLLGLAWIPAKIAGDKGHSFAGYFLFGFFLFLPALIVACVVQPVDRGVHEARMGCPRCGEAVMVTAQMCRFCNLDLSTGHERLATARQAPSAEGGVQVGPMFATASDLWQWLQNHGGNRRRLDEVENLFAEIHMDPASVAPTFLGPLTESNWSTALPADLEGARQWLVGQIEQDPDRYLYADGAFDDGDMAYLCEACDEIFDERDDFYEHLQAEHAYSPRQAAKLIAVAETHAE